MPSTETPAERPQGRGRACELEAAIRSAIFLPVAFIYLVLLGVSALPVLLLPRERVEFARRLYAGGIELLMRVILRQRIEVRGREHIPDGAALVASKHSSPLETIFLMGLFRRPVIVLKKELLRVPIYSLYMRHFESIAVDRSAGAAALLDAANRGRAVVAQGAQIVIFPEGTRVPVGQTAPYKSGVAHLYRTLGVPCVPVAHNAGVFWPHGRWRFYPGTIVFTLLAPLPAGLTRAAFSAALAEAINGETDRLVAEARGCARTGMAA